MSGYSHHIQYLGWGIYRLSWYWDRKYSSSRLRYPQKIERDTDRKGAERFAKKWGLTVPEPPSNKEPSQS